MALPGFNDVGHSVTPIFLLINHFLYQISTFSKINEENLSIETLNLFQNKPWNSVLFSSSFICATISNAFGRVEFCENVENIGITLDPLDKI